MLPSRDVSPSESTPNILAAGALYAGLERGLTADILAARALACTAQTVCTAIVAAGRGRVTDVVEVPADTVDAQLEHIFGTNAIHAVKIGIAGTADAAKALFKRMDQHLRGPLLLDITISGPSGEDIADARVIDVLKENIGHPDLVTIRRIDAELLVGMEIRSLDDAQVAIQRMHRLGAGRTLIRAGHLPARFFETENGKDNYAVDLYYDGDEFILFEAPYMDRNTLHGASSALSMAILKNLALKKDHASAIQAAKRYVSEAVRHSNFNTDSSVLNFFWKQSAGTGT